MRSRIQTWSTKTLTTASSPVSLLDANAGSRSSSSIRKCLAMLVPELEHVVAHVVDVGIRRALHPHRPLEGLMGIAGELPQSLVALHRLSYVIRSAARTRIAIVPASIATCVLRKVATCVGARNLTRAATAGMP
jgi:hypothetical protein